MTQQLKTNKQESLQHCRLSVQITLNGLSFLVTNLYTKEVIFFEDSATSTNQTPEELYTTLHRAIAANSILQTSFEEVILLYATAPYTLVPNSLFDAARVSEYLKFNTKILAGDFIAYDEVLSTDAAVVYVPFVNLNNYIFDRYGSFKYYHATTLLLDRIMKTEKHSVHPKVFVHVLAGSFDLIIINKSGVQLMNRYEYATPEDFIYYILFCFEQLQLNPETVETVLMGSIIENDDLYQILYKYVRNVLFWEHEALAKRLLLEQPHEQPLLKIAQ